MFSRFKMAALAATAIALVSAAPACATTFMFSVNLNGGPDQGLLTGTFDLAGPLNAIWTGAATNMTITAYPAGIPLPQGVHVDTWAQQITNSFTLNFGTISAYDFMALTTPLPNQSAATELCLNNVHANLQGGGRGCAQGSVELGQKVGDFGFRTDAPLVTFSQVTTTAGGVPEPAAWTLMLVGFGALGGALRRRARPALA